MAPPRQSRLLTATFGGAIVFAAAVLLWSRGHQPPDPRPPAPVATAPDERITAPPAPANTERHEAAAGPAAVADPSDGAPTIAEVHVRFRGAPPARVRVFATDDAGVVLAATARPGVAEVLAALTVPPHDWLRIGAITFGEATDDPGTALSQVRTRLGPGERQRVDLEASGVTTTLQLVGPSAGLMPHLRVVLQQAAAVHRRDQREFVLAPDAGGLMRCDLPADPMRATVLVKGRAPVLLAASDGGFDLAARGGTIELTPVEPLLGLVVHGGQRPVAAALSFDEPVLEPVATHHVTTRSRGLGATFVHGWSAAFGPFRVPVDAVRRDGDLWLVEPRPEHQLGELVVTIGEQPEPSSRLDLLAVPAGATTGERLARDAARRRAVLPPGDYRLDWELNGGPAPVAIDPVRIAAGQTTALDLAPLATERWQVRLHVPPECTQPLFLRLEGVYALGASRDGELPIDCAAPPRVGASGDLIVFGWKATFPATVTAVDPTQRRLEVRSALDRAVWTRLGAPAMAGGRTDLRLRQDPKTTSVLPAMLGPQVLLPLLPGQPRDGWVIETIDGEDQLVRWFTAAAGRHDESLAGQGRWTTLTIERPFVTAVLFAQGPGTAAAAKVRALAGRGPHRVFVADGTRALHVDLEPGGRQVIDPTQPALVVR